MKITINTKTKKADILRISLSESLEGYQELLNEAVENKSNEDIKTYKEKIKILKEYIELLQKG
jgi:hypothetical protein